MNTLFTLTSTSLLILEAPLLCSPFYSLNRPSISACKLGEVVGQALQRTCLILVGKCRLPLKLFRVQRSLGRQSLGHPQKHFPKSPLVNFLFLTIELLWSFIRDYWCFTYNLEWDHYCKVFSEWSSVKSLEGSEPKYSTFLPDVQNKGFLQ